METKVWEVLDRKGWNVHTCSPSDTVFSAIDTMDRLEIGALVVTEHNDIQGIITERDYLKKIALQGRSSSDTAVETIMTPDVVWVTPNESVHDCMTIMSHIRSRHLPVLRDMKLAGLISIGDCARQLTLDAEAEIRMLRAYIESRYPA